MPHPEVARIRESLKPLIEAVVKLPENRLREADLILDMYIDGKLSYEEALRELRRLARS